MARTTNRCSSCDAIVSIKERYCPKCGEEIHKRKLTKEYSGVLHQQGRIAIDDDWDEEVSVSREAEGVAQVRCESCGATNKHSQLRCRNCGAKL